MWLGARVLDKLAAIAANQHGLFTRPQAIEAGLSYKVVRRGMTLGRWSELHAGVYRIAGSPSTWNQRLLATCFAWGDKALVSHVTAAAHWNLPPFTRGAIHIIVPRGTRREGHSGIVVHQVRELPAADAIHHQSIPVTTVARTLIDIASTVPVSDLEIALDAALHRGAASLGWLSWKLEQIGVRGRAGVGSLRALIEDRRGSPPPESVMESSLLRVLKKAGLPRPERQYWVKIGTRSMRIDFAYPEHHVAIEADGFEFHSGRQAFDRDRARRNLLTADGWRVLQVTKGDLEEPTAMLQQLRQLLGISSFW